ncbi:MAG: phosphate acyltransferase PlsX [Clostridiales bacterium]|nr:phosphate acyltransferase PlsX [Clostridiales bacterium]
MINIAIDCMGGDNAPLAVLDGCVQAFSLLPDDVHLLLFGDAWQIARYFREKPELSERFSLFPTTEEISCKESPTLAIRRKKDSSLVRALGAVAAGEAEGLLSAGSTGAVLTGATLIVKRLAGVQRPALAPLLPTVNGGHVMLIDCGANTDSKPTFLQQFALMGDAFFKGVMEVEEPRIALLNNGAEEEKGNELTKAAYQLLKQTKGINFIGNIEPRDVLFDEADVIVCDGFEGNMLLKTAEGTAEAIFALLKEGLSSSLLAKTGAALVMPALRALKSRLDWKEVGGAPMLGVNGIVVKAHGSSDARAICRAILQTESLIRGGVVARIAENISALTLE